jgi:DNA polymerase-3 subunit gamma/tau
MTGEALHTKYRPTTLDDVVGQDHIKAGLSAVLAAGKQQAFLFEGPSGTGKTTLARICAKALGCTDPREIDAATHTGVDSMREVAEGARFVSMDGGAKAFIVDECHRLSKQAWESLLKDIEEPPVGVYWFFCTTEGNKVPNTIQTRCVTYSLQEVSWRKLLGLLSKVATAEGLDIADDVLDVCAEEASGSPRKALVNLTMVSHCKSADEARQSLNRMKGGKEAFDLAQLLIKKEYTFEAACAILKELKEVTPESIRHTVRAYATTTVLGSPGNTWARGVLMAFEAPCVDQNQISDILCRVITLEKWKRA